MPTGSWWHWRFPYDAHGTGQFLSRDPMVALTRSPYGYVADNPLNGVDPSGLYCFAFWHASTCSNPLTSSAQAFAGSGAGSFLDGWANAMSAGGAGLVEGLLGAAPNTCDPNYQAGQITGAVTGIALGGLSDAEAAGAAASVIGSPAEFDAASLTGLTPGEVAAQIRSDWAESASNSGGGTVFRDPANPGRQIRIMPGYPEGSRPDPVTTGPHAVVSQNGQW